MNHAPTIPGDQCLAANCACSVEPRMALVLAAPPVTAISTWSEVAGAHLALVAGGGVALRLQPELALLPSAKCQVPVPRNRGWVLSFSLLGTRHWALGTSFRQARCGYAGSVRNATNSFPSTSSFSSLHAFSSSGVFMPAARRRSISSLRMRV